MKAELSVCLWVCLCFGSVESGFLLFAEIDRVEKGDGEDDDKATEAYLDLFTTKNIKLKERVLIPVKQYPKVSAATPTHLHSPPHPVSRPSELVS